MLKKLRSAFLVLVRGVVGDAEVLQRFVEQACGDGTGDA
jgi:hypothetical protein